MSSSSITETERQVMSECVNIMKDKGFYLTILEFKQVRTVTQEIKGECSRARAKDRGGIRLSKE